MAPACVKAVEPIGWWKFDEKDGTTAKDSSGNGFDATVDLGGGPAIWAPGEGFDSNGCAKFTAQQTVTDTRRHLGPSKRPAQYRLLGQPGPLRSAG